jgi:hypothetical protein
MKNLPFFIVAAFAAVTISVVFGVYGVLFVAGLAAGFTLKSVLGDNVAKTSDDCTDGVDCDVEKKIGAPSGGVSRSRSANK